MGELGGGEPLVRAQFDKSQEEMERWLKTFDRNCDGQISGPEWEAAVERDVQIIQVA